MKTMLCKVWKKAENRLEKPAVSNWNTGMPYIYRHSSFPEPRKLPLKLYNLGKSLPSAAYLYGAFAKECLS